MSKPYGFMFDLLPIAAVAAIAFAPRPALYCATLFGCGLLLHSLGGMKADRYISYLLPFFACLWGLATWPFLLGLRKLVLSRLSRFGPWAAGPAASRIATALLASFCLLVAIKAAPMLSQVAAGLVAPGYQRPRNDIRERLWRAAAAEVRPLARKADIFIVDDDLLADFYVARPDLVLNESRRRENAPPAEFVRDYRTGVPTISSEASLRNVLACFKTGLIVEATFVLDWLTPRALAFLTQHTQHVQLDPLLDQFTWTSSYGEPTIDCRDLVRLTAASRQERHNAPAARALATRVPPGAE